MTNSRNFQEGETVRYNYNFLSGVKAYVEGELVRAMDIYTHRMVLALDTKWQVQEGKPPVPYNARVFIDVDDPRLERPTN